MSTKRVLRCLAAFYVFSLATVLTTPVSEAKELKLRPEILSGLHFRTIGPAVMSGRTVAVAVVEKDPYTFYIAAASGGVWKTTNNGVTFDHVFRNQGTHSIGHIAVHQVDTDVVWVGTGESFNRQSSSWGDGVYKSTDGGETWKNMGLQDSRHIGRIVMHPENPDIVYVAAMGHLWGANEERGLYKSENGGETWQRILWIDPDTGVVDAAVDPSDPDTVYAAAYQRRRKAFGYHGGGPGSGLYKSTDAGNTWKKLTNGLPEGDKGRIGISIYRKDPRIVYVTVEQGFRYNASTAYEKRLAGVYRSEDKGESWRWMSDWNPRPSYGSQIVVDPNDDQRIYQLSFSYSDDGGKTFQGRHGDDRFVWVNPNDSRHLILAYDQGVDVSYDRGQTWTFLGNLPLSQFYRVSVDMRKPYWVYGGLQDNGSWAGPSATYRAEGILNEDWIRTGGGDGFVNLVHPVDSHLLFTESQYLGLGILDLESRQRRRIRPGEPEGFNAPGMIRRNWDAWGPGLPEPELGNVMSPANWDGPFIISPHNPDTLYAGTNEFWKSLDRGYSWTSLGDLTTGVDRRELRIMGQRPDEYTASLDDGVPYYPTLSAIAESPLREGLLYAGTADGNLQVSLNGGQTWENAAGRLPGAPRNPYIAGIEPSQFDEATVYVVVNNYRNNDYENYLYKSTDYGKTWTSITAGLPPGRGLRTLREDTRNPQLLFLGAELGLYLSIDGGGNWAALQNNMPTAAFNDLVIHPRDNDLVLATHGLGIWILDNINALQEITPAVLGSEAHLFTIEPAEMIRYDREKNSRAVVFRGENPPAGAIIDYYLGEKHQPDSVSLDILDANGKKFTGLRPALEAGINRVVWNFRHSNFTEDPQSLRGPLVSPGLYTAQLTVNGKAYKQNFLVQEDPRIKIPVDERKEWTQTLLNIGRLHTEALQVKKAFDSGQARIHKLIEDGADIEEAAVNEMNELDRMINALIFRIRVLYGNASQWPGRLTVDQQSQKKYYEEMRRELGKRVQDLISFSPSPGAQ